VIVIGVEAGADVEVLGAIDVRDGDRDELELEVHDFLSVGVEAEPTRYSGQLRS
jgi:hypothetical protein